MSIQSVKEFYVQLAVDEAFRAKVKGAQGLEQGMAIIQEAGYDFTAEEWEDYTVQILEASSPLQELTEQQSEAVVGGTSQPATPWTFPGVQLPPGVNIPPDILSGLPVGWGQPPGSGGGAVAMYGTIAPS
jgi:predicted ribosomally synthesized peptide with nif11-like leader